MSDAAYPLCVGAGIALAALAVRWAPAPDAALPAGVGGPVRLAALIGAVAGAYLLELPADLLGWSAPAAAGVHAIGGRTILGGLLGGWLAVELQKARLGHRRPTGDAFALPLAIALACGRIGCTLRGCCRGVPLPPGTPLGAVAAALHGEPRFPAALIEAWFHAGAAVVLVVLAARRRAAGRRLAGYLALYAGLRFALEWGRDHPRPFAGLTYYQLLALALLGVAGGAWWRRRPGAAGPAGAGRAVAADDETMNDAGCFDPGASR